MNAGSFFKDKRVLITGGTGFVGTNLSIYLKSIGCHVRIVSRGLTEKKCNFDFEQIKGDLSNLDDCKKVVKDIDYVFHLAASGFTSISNPSLAARTFNDNLLMNGNILRESLRAKVKSFLFASSGSVYPPNLDLLEEERAWDGNPHPSEWYFAWTKRMGELQCKSLYDEFGFPISICRIGAVYGPYDNFDPITARVVPALIRRVVSNENPLKVWGSGKAIRSFIYVNDVVECLCDSLESYAVADPLNVASPISTTIKELVLTITEVSNYKGQVDFDTSKPEGNPLKVMSHKKAFEKIAFQAKTSLKEGLAKTIQWYQSNEHAK
jgi:GDP-L-fucose synthase